MRIGFFSDHPYVVEEGSVYSSGAMSTQIWDRYLVRESSDLVVVGRTRNASRSKAVERKICDHPRVTFEFVKSFSNLRSFFGLNPDRIRLRQLVKECDRVIAKLPSEIGNRAVNHARQYGIPVAVETVACVFDSLRNNGSWAGLIYAPLAMIRMKRAVRSADAVMYVTQSFLQNRYPSNGRQCSVSNVSIDQVCSHTVNNTRCKLLSRARIRLVLIGSLENRIKGIETAVRALRLLSGTYSVELQVIGGGDSSHYKLLADQLNVGDRITFPGFFADRFELFEALDNADFYIQPSFQEGLPRATIEAMSRGCPVVASTAGGLPEIVHPRLLHKPGDYKELANKIELLIREPPLYKEAVEHSLSIAGEFLRPVLDARRTLFWQEFIAPS